MSQSAAAADGIGPWIQSFTGQRIDPLRLDPAAVSVHDVQHALSLAARFAGHTRRPYSVGAHSLAVAETVALDRYFARRFERKPHHEDAYIFAQAGEVAAKLRLSVRQAVPELCKLAAAIVFQAGYGCPEDGRALALDVLDALLHDASEYCLVDLPTPVKHRLEVYRAFEADTQASIVAELSGLVRDSAEPTKSARHARTKAADLAVLFAEKRRLLVVDLPDWSPGLERNPRWAFLADAVLGPFAGSYSEAERRCYMRHTPGHEVPADPHSPVAVERAFYHLYSYLCAVLDGHTAEDAIAQFAAEVNV